MDYRTESMDLVRDSLSPPTTSADMRSDDERALRMTHRKFNKHMAEKRRRARINKALEEMKNMVLRGMSKDPEHYDKMEKADILDLTVKYLSTVVSESAELSAAATSGRKFRAGYSECLKEVDQFLNTVAMETSAKSRLVGHLTSQAQAMTFQHMTDAAGERMVLDDVRRRETSAAHARGAPTAIVAPVHVAAPHTITRASSASAFRPEAHSAHDDAYLESRMKGDGRSKELVFPPTVSFTDTLPPLPAPLLFPHPGTMPHPEVLRPVPIDLRHKFCPPAVDRCVPVPVYDGRRPWDRPVSV